LLPKKESPTKMIKTIPLDYECIYSPIFGKSKKISFNSVKDDEKLRKKYFGY